MNDLSKDVLIGSLYMLGIWSFVSGLFVISTVLFASAAMFGNMIAKAHLNG
ncbi:hypothetical protein [Methylomonas sp. MgM2]